MNVAPVRISKVELESFNFKREIENRKLISSLSSFELEMLKEIVYNSLKFNIDDLCSSLGIEYPTLKPLLERLVDVGLCRVEKTVAFVDKDLRRIFEFQLSKFDDTFEPNMEYVQTLLQQVPIHVLPLWYCLPKNTDDIFLSIIEKNLSTPKIYKKYLQELPYENMTQEAIVKDVLSSKDLSLSTAFLKKKYSLDETAFLETMLYLEYSLACFCIFVETENGFEERVAPLWEWKTWLQFQESTVCKPVNEALVQRDNPSDFGFIEEMTKTLSDLKYKPSQEVLSKLHSLSFIDLKGKAYSVTASGKEWLTKKDQEKGMGLYLHTMNKLRREEGIYTDKDIREIEKSLKRALNCGTVLLEDFFKGLCCNVGGSGPVQLTKKGKKWSFAIPSYTEDEKSFIADTIMGVMFEAGVTATGMLNGKPCFKLTPFGRMVIGD